MASSLAPDSIISSDSGVAYSNPYSSFAISVDSRDAEGATDHVSGQKSLARHAALQKASYDYAGRESAHNRFQRASSASPAPGHKKRSSSPEPVRNAEIYNEKSGSVRFAALRDDGDHRASYTSSRPYHRRSSTAAFIEYVRSHLPEHHHRPVTSLTPKRALGLFCIVFSATYLALALLPLVGRVTPYQTTVQVVRRGEGYYGNSHIFQGGENLGDPHLEGDEHQHYVDRQRQPPGRRKAAKSEQGFSSGAVDEGMETPGRKLRTSTLREQADVEARLEVRRAQRQKAAAGTVIPNDVKGGKRKMKVAGTEDGAGTDRKTVVSAASPEEAMRRPGPAPVPLAMLANREGRRRGGQGGGASRLQAPFNLPAFRPSKDLEADSAEALQQLGSYEVEEDTVATAGEGVVEGDGIEERLAMLRETALLERLKQIDAVRRRKERGADGRVADGEGGESLGRSLGLQDAPEESKNSGAARRGGELKRGPKPGLLIKKRPTPFDAVDG